jgi:predicted AAA+ superfamily ATPase
VAKNVKQRYNALRGKAMYREAFNHLAMWKEKKDKKPLFIRGARQVGKTWLMRTLGEQSYEHTVYINFDNNQQMKSLFSQDMNIERIIMGLELYAGKKINSESTLLIFDEIQEVPIALASLKYFNEQAPQYQIMCAGSLPGVALHGESSFPVGRVEFMDLYPLSFSEFMLALGKEQYVEVLRNGDFEMASTFRDDYTQFLKYYYYVGGMPEVVAHFVENKDFKQAREIQEAILQAYEHDFSKHAHKDIVPKLRMLWNSIPSQLARENKKFLYGLIREGARAKEYEMAMLWLIDCGLMYKVPRINTPKLPLKAYEDLKAFKLFIVDVGLLSCMVRLHQTVLLEGNHVFEEFKGALTEQYVLQQLNTVKGLDTYYWSNPSGRAEVDFILDTGNRIVPLEVKAAQNLRSKSLRTFKDKYDPEKTVRTALVGYKQEDWFTNLPLWAVEYLMKAIQ